MDTSVIQALLPPVAIVLSCALLCLGQFARYNSIVGRDRRLHHERLDLLIHLPDDAEDIYEQRLMAPYGWARMPDPYRDQRESELGVGQRQAQPTRAAVQPPEA